MQKRKEEILSKFKALLPNILNWCDFTPKFIKLKKGFCLPFTPKSAKISTSL